MLECEKAKIVLSTELETTLRFDKPELWKDEQGLPDLIEVLIRRDEFE